MGNHIQNLDHGWPYTNQYLYAKPQSGTSSILQSPQSGLKGHVCSLHLHNQDRVKIQNMGVSKTSDYIHIKIMIQNHSQEPPASFKAPNQDLKDMGVLCTLKIKIESQNSEHGYIKDQRSYPNQDQDSKPQSGTSSILQSPKSGLKGHGCSLHLQNQDREPKFGIWV